MSHTDVTVQRRHLAPISLIAATMLAAGCGSTKIVTEPPKTVTNTGSTPASTTSTGPAKPKPDIPPNDNPPRQAKIGSTLTLEGFQGEKMQVKVLDYLDPATAGEFDQPQSGGRFVGVKIRMTNAGGTAYSDSPANGAKLITNTDEEADATITTGGSCDATASSSTKIAPGSSRVLCLPFEIPASQKGATFQFTLNSGFADETGEWSLKK